MDNRLDPRTPPPSETLESILGTTHKTLVIALERLEQIGDKIRGPRPTNGASATDEPHNLLNVACHLRDLASSIVDQVTEHNSRLGFDRVEARQVGRAGAA